MSSLTDNGLRFERHLKAKVLWLLLIICGLSLIACEGGKNKPEDCKSYQSDREPYLTPCKSGSTPVTETTPSCETQEVWVNGACQLATGFCAKGQLWINNRCELASNNCEPGYHWENERCQVDQLKLELINQSSCRNTTTGASRIIAKFITRDQQNRVLVPQNSTQNSNDAVTSQFLIDRALPDSESLLSQNSELLKSNLAVSLILDSTYSMLEHKPPAFEPMKTAAMKVLNDIDSMWKERQSQFNWDITWFDGVIYRPLENNRGLYWNIDDIASIPSPVKGNYTGLWKAVQYGIQRHNQWLQQNIAVGERDQHILIVFSDGEDNNSFFDNSGPAYQGSQTNDQLLFWRYFGYAPTRYTDVLTALEKTPKVRVFVIAFGQAFGEEGSNQLLNLAQKGKGLFIRGTDSTQLTPLFDSVKNEFATAQTLGVEASLDPGKPHQFQIRSQHAKSGAEGILNLSLDISQPMANCP